MTEKKKEKFAKAVNKILEVNDEVSLYKISEVSGESLKRTHKVIRMMLKEGYFGNARLEGNVLTAKPQKPEQSQQSDQSQLSFQPKNQLKDRSANWKKAAIVLTIIFVLIPLLIVAYSLVT